MYEKTLKWLLYGALVAFAAFVVGYEQGARETEYRFYMEGEAVQLDDAAQLKEN